MLEHQLISVTPDDKPLTPISKYEAHASSTVQLHRAFSLFLLTHDRQNLLLQKRSSSKITFPNLWTNTCCSHPRFNNLELGKLSNNNSIQGTKFSVVRRLNFEMNMKIKPEDLNFKTKILYQAASCDQWVEKELDYLYFGVLDKDFELSRVSPNTNEVSDVKLVNLEECLEMPEEELTPWFSMIRKSNLLKNMWQLDTAADDKIHNFLT